MPSRYYFGVRLARNSTNLCTISANLYEFVVSVEPSRRRKWLLSGSWRVSGAELGVLRRI